METHRCRESNVKSICSENEATSSSTPLRAFRLHIRDDRIQKSRATNFSLSSIEQIFFIRRKIRQMPLNFVPNGRVLSGRVCAQISMKLVESVRRFCSNGFKKRFVAI